MWNEFIANKITLKCINKNGKIICFTFTFHPSSSFTKIYFNINLLLFLTYVSSAPSFPSTSILYVIVKVNILRYQGEFFLALRTAAKKKFFQQFYRNEDGETVMGQQIKYPPSNRNAPSQTLSPRRKKAKNGEEVNSRILHTI